MTDPKERPILFNGPMVRATLASDKRQTRRTRGLEYFSLPENDPGGWWCARVADGQAHMVYKHSPHERTVRCPYGQPGDRLWVRETFVQGYPYDPVRDRHLQYDEDGDELPMKTWYRATDSGIGWADDDGWETNVPWRPSIHMPRLACRLVLEITGVRVERLQAISEGDAEAEGVSFLRLVPDADETLKAKQLFECLWSSINGGDSWAANPWVWVVEFRMLPTQPSKDRGGDEPKPDGAPIARMSRINLDNQGAS